MKSIKKSTTTRKTRVKKETKLPQLSLDEKINVITNFIVDRLIEEQQKGTFSVSSGKRE